MTKCKHFKALVADGSPVFRFGLATLLKNVKFINKIDQVSNGNEILKILESTIYDIVFIELQANSNSEIEVINKIINIYPGIKIIALILSENYIYKEDILQSGIHGFLLKNCDLSEITKSLNDVSIGKKYYTPKVLNLISLYKDHKAELKRSSLADKNQLAIMFLMYHEKSSKEIARLLNLSCRTVEDYRMKLLRKTNSVNLIGIMKYVFENGIHKDEFLNKQFGKFCIKKNQQMIDYIR